MTKKINGTGQIAQEVVHVPVGSFVFVEGPQAGYQVCEEEGHLIRVIPGSDNGQATLYDGDVESGKKIAHLHLENMHTDVDFNIYFETELTLVLDDDAKITVIYDFDQEE